MQDTIDLLVRHEVQATFLLTHKSELNASIESSRFFEVGIHPNFNFLLNGTDTKARNAHEVMGNLTQHVRSPKAIRSHSVVSSSPLQQIYKEFGITHDLNSFIPNNSGIILRPFFSYNGLITVPYCWEDDAHLIFEISDSKEVEPVEISKEKSGGIKVFNFHPIHVYLNTESITQYENARDFQNSQEDLNRFVNVGYGTRNRFIELLNYMSKHS
jgi:hypothetical protein